MEQENKCSKKSDTDNQMRPIRWGLLGAGAILYRWMKGVAQVDRMEIAAVASRTRATAEKMAETFGIPEALSYEEILQREDIDIMYIPVPHPAHKDLAIRAMNAGKAVLVEKPAGINAGEWDEMTECAKKNHVFLMEAVWTRFFPLMEKLEPYFSENGIGSVRAVSTNFSYRTEDPSSRLFDMEKAGGGLLDTGVYNLHFTQMILKKNPVRLMGLASMDTDEMHLQVDEQAAYIAQYDKGELGMMCSAVRTDMIDTAYIYGTKGHMILPKFWKPTKAIISIGEKTEVVEAPAAQRVEGIEDEGYQYEIAHVNQCLREKKLESPVMTWQQTRDILAQCDELRRQWGLIYPQEQQTLQA